MNLVQQDYWDKGYESYSLDVATKDDYVRQWFESYFEKSNGRCLEIGCFPGRYLAVFGELGYELNGIDLTPRVETDLPNWLRDRKYNIGKFLNIDFRDYYTDEVFDVVSSFGFIEHFYDWEEMLIKQASFVGNEGYLLVAVPNFSGFVQQFLHKTLDRQNYLRHFVPAMDPLKWEKIISGLGFDIIYCGTFGRFDFWVDAEERSKFQNLLLSIIKRLMPTFKKLPKDKKIYSPYYGLIAKNTNRVK